jgi:hypothetical protein
LSLLPRAEARRSVCSGARQVLRERVGQPEIGQDGRLLGDDPERARVVALRLLSGGPSGRAPRPCTERIRQSGWSGE